MRKLYWVLAAIAWLVILGFGADIFMNPQVYFGSSRATKADAVNQSLPALPTQSSREASGSKGMEPSAETATTPATTVSVATSSESTTVRGSEPPSEATSSFTVPDGWGERTGEKWSTNAFRAVHVTELGKALGFAENRPLGHAWWQNESGEYQGVYVQLRKGFHGIQFVSAAPDSLRGPYPVIPHFESDYYTYWGAVRSAQEITVDRHYYPPLTQIYTVRHKWIRGEEENIGGKRCCQVDPVASEISDLGTALGYEEGELVGPRYWAEWQPDDAFAANPNPVAAYETSGSKESQPSRERGAFPTPNVPVAKNRSDQNASGSNADYAHFEKWGISFDYPKAWNEFPTSQTAMMKNALASQAEPYGRHMQEFAGYMAGESILMVVKYATVNPMTASDFVKERNTAYDEAKRAGDVTKVNYVRETTVAKLLAVEEDVERSNGGRGRTLKLINGSTVFEIMFVVPNATAYSANLWALDQIVSSIVVGESSQETGDSNGKQPSVDTITVPLEPEKKSSSFSPTDEHVKTMTAADQQPELVSLFWMKPNRNGISNVLRLYKEGDVFTPNLLVVPPETGEMIKSCYADEDEQVVNESATGKNVARYREIECAVIVEVDGEHFDGTAKGRIPILATDITPEIRKDAKTIAGMALGAGNCVEVTAKTGMVAPFMVIFDDTGKLITTYCVNGKPDPNYRLIRAKVAASTAHPTTECPREITRVEKIWDSWPYGTTNAPSSKADSSGQPLKGVSAGGKSVSAPPNDAANRSVLGSGPSRNQPIPSTEQANKLPPFTSSLSGPEEVRVKNPNEFAVKVGLRSGGNGKDFDVPANGTQSVSVPDGRYDIYFVYSNDPEGLYQGDSFTLSNNGVEIQIVKVVNGNYGIRKVK